MSNASFGMCVAGLSALSLLSSPAALANGASGATPDESEAAALRARVAELEARMENLQAVTGMGGTQSSWLDQEHDEEFRALMSESFADAQLHSSYLGAGAAEAGWDPKKGFYISSADGAFLLQYWACVQFRYIYNHLEEPGPTTDGDLGGFEMRRVCTGVRGNLFDEFTHYNIWGDFNRGDAGRFRLMEAWLEREFGKGWSARFGQIKDTGFLHEFTVAFRKPMAVERSLLTFRYGNGFSQGVQLRHRAEKMQAIFFYSDGANQQNSTWSARDTEWGALTARIEFLPIGTNWDLFTDAVSFPGTDTHLMVGAAAHYEEDEYGLGDNETETLKWTVDASLKGDGWNIMAYVLGQHDDTQGSDTSSDEYAFAVEGGVFVDPTIQIFARYEWADPDTKADEELSIVTAGFTKFWHKHNLQWTNDLGYGINGVASYFANDAAGWRADTEGEDGQIVFRSQLQWGF